LNLARLVLTLRRIEATSGIPEVDLQLLQSDLQRLEDRVRDEKFCLELYRALADNKGARTARASRSAGSERRR
jgi:hypothetical protein